MNDNNEIFLETTSIVDYALKKKYRRQIQMIIKQYNKKISSNYVRMELKKGVIANLVYLHNKIKNCESWSQVMEAIYRLSATPQRNKLSTCLEVLQIFWSEIEQKATGKAEISDYLMKQSPSSIRIMIRKLWKQIDKITDEKQNPMSCFVDIQPTKMVGDLLENSPAKCNNSKHECEIKDFFKENLSLFEAVFSHLSNLPANHIDAETERRIKALKEIIRLLPYNGRKFSNKEPNVTYCWNCSDAILSIITPSETHILHRNPRHFIPICRALNKQSVTY
jgi:hypothetical protein